ncbi:MAG: serine/threonine protein kinase [Phycisphaerae bacterium]|nr:serine/threonine protein kinase [Phycisphaerae bacterium]
MSEPIPPTSPLPSDSSEPPDPTDRLPQSAIPPLGSSTHERPTSAEPLPPSGYRGVPRAPDDPYFIPERVGPYRVLREVGRGGMGSVLLAMRDGDRLAPRVAIKLVKRGMDTQELLRRFQLERQVIGALNHPNIARVLDAGATEDGRPFFVMEHIEGQSIDDYCDSNALGTSERLKLFCKVCSAVHYAHQNLIVHRDLKPSNILVTKEGEPKLLDFGIAKLLNAEVLGISLSTAPEARLMTPEYASPEQVRGEPISTASDVYSLGVILYELLTGRRPYNFKSRLANEIERVICEVDPEPPSTAVTHPAEVYTKDGQTRTLSAEEIARKQEARPTTLRRRLSGDIDNIVMMAMRKAARRRYSSAEQLAADIFNHMEGRPVIARRDTFMYVFGKFAQRNKLPIGAAAVMVLLLAAGAAGTATGWIRARANQVLAERERDRSDRLYALARDGIGDFFLGVNKEIKQLDGATPARMRLIQTSRAVAEKLRKEAGDDPALKLILGRALHSLGEAQGGTRGASGGDRDAAIGSFREALTIRRDLASSNPKDPRARADVAETLLNLADVLYLAGQSIESASAMQEAAAASASAAKDAPDNPAFVRQHAMVIGTIGDRLLREQRIDEAEAHYLQHREIAQRLLATWPNDLNIMREALLSPMKLGQIYEDSGRLEAALNEYRAALAGRERIAALEPENASLRRDVSNACERVGRVLTRLARFDEAEACYARMTALNDELIASDPNDLRSRADSVRFLSRRADLLVAMGDPAGALTLVDRGIELARARLAAAPTDSESLYNLASSLERRADLLAAAGAHAEAEPAYRECVSAYDRAAAGLEQNLMLVRRAAAAKLRLAAFLDERRSSSADAAFDAAIAAFQRITQGPNASDVDRQGLARALSGLSVRAARARSAPQAMQYAKRALDASGRRTPEVLRALAWAHHAAGESTRACEIAREALAELSQRPVADDRLRAQLDDDIKSFSATTQGGG